jgi:hypothetical protein
MNDFIMIFRNDYTPEVKHAPEQMQELLKKWQNWVGGIAAQGKLADPGNRLSSEGKTLKPNNVVTNGPYTEIKEMISGYISVKGATLDEAFELAKGCPILEMGGNVEVRSIVPMSM